MSNIYILSAIFHRGQISLTTVKTEVIIFLFGNHNFFLKLYSPPLGIAIPLPSLKILAFRVATKFLPKKTKELRFTSHQTANILRIKKYVSSFIMI